MAERKPCRIKFQNRNILIDPIASISSKVLAQMDYTSLYKILACSTQIQA